MRSAKKYNNQSSSSPSGKKSKKLNSICEDEYKRNHGESKGRGDDGESELRRSSRVRKIPKILDASPPPPKKRRRLIERVVKEEENDNPDGWKARLRERRRNVGGGGRQNGMVNRKREMREKVMKMEKNVEVKESESSEDEEKETDSSNADSESEESMQAGSESGEEEEKETIKRAVVLESENEDEGDGKESESESESESEDGTDSTEKETEDSDEEGESEIQGSVDSLPANVDGVVADTNVVMEAVENECGDQTEGFGNEIEMEVEEIGDKEVTESGNGNCIVRSDSDLADTIHPELPQKASIEVSETLKPTDDIVEQGVSTDKTKDDGDKGNESVEMLDELPIQNETSNKVDDSSDRLGKPLLKQARRCGLCGVGTDGKRPKKLMQDNGDSDIEAHSGSSSSEEPNYDILDGFGDDPGWLGRLLGPINDRYGISGTWVHQHCAVWSPEVYFAGVGCLKNIRAALYRGKSLKCTRCDRPGATIGCRVDRCPRTYHLPCARANGCIFDHRKFLIACTDHRHHFQPHGRQSQSRIKKMKAKRMRMEMRKSSNDAWRKDVEAEERWFDKCGEDEEFLKRESKRLHRDLSRVAPEYIGGSGSENGKEFEGWDSVAGLESVTQCMKEVVLVPLLYPEFFDNLGLTPPRGILLHGHPGTGKTLVVRALIGSLARGNKRIAYFARKGADCLGKYVGDAERQLRLLFQVAEKCQPSIIFFDEIDGLAPKRSRHQDQTHSSVVSTLLALLDGLKSRGSVVVIGATNYPDAIDPALRRPGRFDREIYFPLPSVEDRAAIVSLHTRKWPKPVSVYLLKWIAKETAGFAGADIQALCTQAAMIGLNRSFPLQESLAAAELGISSGNRAALPTFSVEERDWLEALSRSPPPCSRRGAGIAANDIFSSPLPVYLVPSLLPPLCSLLIAFHLDERIVLPPLLSKAASDVQNVIRSKISEGCWWSHAKSLLKDVDVVKDIVQRLSYVGLLDGGCDLVKSGSGDGDSSSGSAKFMLHRGSANASVESMSKSGFQLLIAGGVKSGQRHLASCILHCFIGNGEMQKIDSATISQEGNGDLVLGIAHLLIKCASKKSCVVFMPRIDLWAVETETPPDEDVECDDDSARASLAWNTFFEQVESLRVSTKMMILATSGIPYKLLPPKILQFFKTDLSKEYQPTLSEAVPQFTVQVLENSDNDMAIDLSATELSRRAIQAFLHLVNQGNHTRHDLKKEYKRMDAEVGVKSKPIDDSSLKVPPLPTTAITVKPKSSLQLAVSTFGYQILQYPQFAELCWVTSKLKEGPSADVSGPWRGWPFNSCIIRPLDSSEQNITASGSNKGKDSSGIVRGLVAVGLSAYRGTYISLREVSCEVRKVLELLVGLINVKIDAGKDRCRYIRILSQVAYLEDMVNSWVYAMRSFESNAQPEPVNPSLQNEKGASDLLKGSEEDNLTANHQPVVEVTNALTEPAEPLSCSVDNPSVQNEQRPEEDPKERANSHTEPLTTHSTDGLTLVKENGLLRQAVLLDLNCPAADNDQNEAPEGVHGMETTNHTSETVEQVETATTVPLDDPSFVCLYRCCPRCFSILKDSMHKLVTRELKLGKISDMTTEGIHDAVSSLSVKLITTVRKFISANDKREAKVEESDGCSCKSSHVNILASVECCSHSAEEQKSSSEGPKTWFEPVFVFRDGILVPVITEDDSSLHCIYDKFCLGSLIEVIATKMKPF